ncbi:MAG: acetate--CoA ligase [Halanaeroarchaeum sp.]
MADDTDPDGDGALESRLTEQEYFRPPTEFVGQANVTDSEIYDRFDENWPEAYEEFAELLSWDDHWDEVLDDSNPPFFEWFTGGTLNASYNAVDRHLPERKDHTAIIWEGEHGTTERIAYQDLYRRVNEMAAVLREVGVEEDDIVTMHMPMVPDLPVSMLAAARIGAPHSEVFAGFSAQALADRIDDAGSDVVVTIDGYYRRGEFLNHKEKADKALELAETDPETVLLFTREDELHEDVAISSDDPYVLVDEVLEEKKGATVEPVARDAEDPLFLMYTSGTTGKPKGAQHRTGGYLSYVTATSKYVLDIEPEDTYWCSADIGWITGHSYIVYGPLSLGTTTVMYEGAPDFPHKGRIWEIAERYDVDIFHTSPTAVRMFMKWGEDIPQQYDFDFRHMTTVGEPIQPEAWLWYYKYIGDEDAVIVDTWWQTETGGHLITNLPALKDMKPGSAGYPVPGIQPAILDDEGNEIEPATGQAGNLVIKKPWPGMLQTVYGNDERFIDEYWRDFSDTSSDDPADWVYKAGDGAVHERDGYWRILGRLDDVMNVAGHRLGTMELESAVAEVSDVAEAAVAGRDDPEKGTVPDVYVTLREGVEPSDEVRERIVGAIEEEIGKFARPANVWFVDELPKTRSGKIMRRLLEDISNDADLGNTTTLRDTSVPEAIRRQVQED